MRVIHYIREKWQLTIREKCLDLHSKRATLVSLLFRVSSVDFCENIR